MTESEKIIGFLKYASSRLDYLEKQAFWASRAAKLGKTLLNFKKSKYADTLTKGEYKDMFASRAAHDYMNNRRVLKYAEKYNLTPQEVLAKSLDRAKERHGSNAVRSLYNAINPNAQRSVKVSELEKTKPQSAEEWTQRAIVGPDKKTISKGVKQQASDIVKNDAASIRPAADNKLMSIYNTVNEWAKANPLAAAGIGTAGGSAVGGGLGYGLGHSSGSSSALDTANSYYQMREWLRQQQLQGANDSFLSRLANLFGTGELSNMIG